MTDRKAVREPLFQISKRDGLEWWKAWLIRLAAIAISLFVASLLCMILSGKNPVELVSEIFKGVFGTERKFKVFLREAAFLLCIAIAITPAFKMKFWNIGAEGQVLMGALACAMCMQFFGGKVADGLLVVIELFASILFGIVWAVIPAIFKAKWNTNETLFTLMMNYIATQFVLYFVNKCDKSGQGMPIRYPEGHMPIMIDKYFDMVIIVTVITLLVFVYMKYTKHGFELSLVGESQSTAKYVGINVKKVIIRTLIVSGAICGIAGFLLCAGDSYSVSSNTAAGRGFTAIIVSWLAKFNPLIMILTSAFVVFLQKGTYQAASTFKISNALPDIIVGIVFLFVIGCEFFVEYKIKLHKKAPADFMSEENPSEKTAKKRVKNPAEDKETKEDRQ